MFSYFLKVFFLLKIRKIFFVVQILANFHIMFYFFNLLLFLAAMKLYNWLLVMSKTRGSAATLKMEVKALLKSEEFQTVLQATIKEAVIAALQDIVSL